MNDEPYLIREGWTGELPEGWIKADWFPALSEVVENYLAAHPEVGIVQVKEKFACLEIYLFGGREDFRELIKPYRALSLKTCCQCGKPAKWRTIHGWISNYCDDCAWEGMECNPICT